MVVDLNQSNDFEPLEDKILVGSTFIDETTGFKFWEEHIFQFLLLNISSQMIFTQYLIIHLFKY